MAIKGLILVHWNEKAGAETICQYPPEFSLPSAVLMNLYAMHLANEEPGNSMTKSAEENYASMSSAGGNYSTYYSGRTQYYFIAELDKDEDPSKYESAVKYFMHQHESDFRKPEFITKILPKWFNEMKLIGGLSGLSLKPLKKKT